MNEHWYRSIRFIKILQIATIVLIFHIALPCFSAEANVTNIQLNSKQNFIQNDSITKFTPHELWTRSQRKFYIKLGRKLFLVISPILLSLGGIGNAICIIVLARKSKNNPTIMYLCLLAVFDMLVLYTGLLRNYLKMSLNFDIRSYSSFNCKVHLFLTYTFMQISAYILVAVTINRFTIMFNRNIFCKTVYNTRQRKTSNVYWILVIICSVVVVMNSHFLVFYDLINAENKNYVRQDDCTIDAKQHPNYYWFRANVYGNLHLFLFVVLPCTILFILNILIINKLRQSKSSSVSQSKLMKNKEEKKATLSVMLVSVCLWFMVLKTPASVYLGFPDSEVAKVYFPFTYGLFMLINYTNHAVNLFLYISISETFRNEFKEFFKSIKKKIFFCKKRNINEKDIVAVDGDGENMLENTV